MKELLSEKIVNEWKLRVKQASAELIDRGAEPHLAVVQVGADEQSVVYIGIKNRVAKELGITCSLYHIEEEADISEVRDALLYLASDESVHGIVLQLPLPESYTSEQVNELIDIIPSQKDVDGLRGDWEKLTYTQTSTESLAERQPVALPPMVLSVVSLLNAYSLETEGKKVVCVGNGKLVGQPVTKFFQKVGRDAVAVDEDTDDILSITKTADILITGTGQPDLITYQWVKEGAVVLNCSGDVHVDSVAQVASALSPAKGGIGPLTVIWLMYNVLQATKNQTNA